MYQHVIKPLLFLLPPELAHKVVVGLLDTMVALPAGKYILSKLLSPTQPAPVQVMGLTFRRRVGLAAGFDKNAEHIESMAALGFGFVEVGTVTPRAQEGQAKPRLFRLPEDEALINRMGFNNKGVDAMAKALQTWRSTTKNTDLIIGGNIGKNKDTPNEQAAEDYLVCMKKLHHLVDYFVVNVSSPNTPHLRALQEKEPLTQLLMQLQTLNHSMTTPPKPVLLKIAPDLTDEQLHDIAEIVRHTQLTGIVATNTTLSRENLQTPRAWVETIGTGGLSGQPLRRASTRIIQKMRQLLGDEYVIIGVGGINSVESAREKFEAGADLVQVYTGLIFNGVGFIRKI